MHYNPELLAASPVVGILRGFVFSQIAPIVEASIRGGLRNLEITMNSRGAVDQIRRAVESAAGGMNVGAGTVTGLGMLEAALAAGAGFIVTPTLCFPVIERCVRLGVPVFPGSFTPSEVYAAWEAGATMVKVFPSETGGAGYVRALLGPFPEIRLMPTGGVDLGSLADYAQAGARAVGVGSPLFDRARVDALDWGWVEARCRAFVGAAETLSAGKCCRPDP